MAQQFDPAISHLQSEQNGLRSQPQSHDELLMLATNRFCDTNSGDRLSHNQYIEAFGLLIGSVTQPTRQMVARLLAFCPFAPRELVLKFAYDTLDVALPMLRNSQSLSQLDLLTLINTEGSNHCAAIAMRPDLGATVVGALRALNDETVNQYLKANQAFPILATRSSIDAVASSSAISLQDQQISTTQMNTSTIAAALEVVQEETSAEAISLFEVAEAHIEVSQQSSAQQDLLQAAARGGRLDIAPPPLAPAIETPDWDFGEAMEKASRTSNRQAICTIMMKRYGIDLTSAHQVMEDDSGDTLAVTLKAAKVEKGQANRIQILAHPTIGLSVQNAMRAVRFYATLTPESCLEAIEQWPKAELATSTDHMPATADTDGLRERHIGTQARPASAAETQLDTRRFG
ncbi:hypothetical protein R2A130_1431 [Ahrensia sp. R2A130]|nr:hypothetical protein R2A130_1431 [Ahrensia sp. R2A130]